MKRFIKNLAIGLLLSSSLVATAQTNSIGTSLYDWAMDWNVSAFSVATVFEQDVADKGGSRFSSDNQLTFKRKIKDSNWKYGFGIPFIYGTGGYDRFNGDEYQKEELFLKDLFVTFDNGKLALLPGNIEVYGSVKVYLPTSEYSQNMGQITRIKPFLIFTKPISRWFEAKYFLESSYYAQTKTAARATFKDDNGFEVEYAQLTPAYDIEHWAEVWFKATNSEGIGFKVGSEDRYYNQSEVENKKREPKRTMSLGPAIRFEVSAFRFQLVYENEVNVDENASDYGLFKAEHSQLTLLTWIDI